MKILASTVLILSTHLAYSGGVSPTCTSSTGTSCYKTIPASEIENVEVAGNDIIFRWTGFSARDIQYYGAANPAVANRILSVLLSAKATGSKVIIYISSGDWNLNTTNTLTISNIVLP